MKRYLSERSERWEGFEHRPGDIVVSTRTKAGTTWMQMVCLSLIHGTPLPAPLSLLSPWIDWEVEPTAVVRSRLAAQAHRRVIKTH
ncbi:MAG: sulfotransferase domain-containing protein, partial [Acidimicrobiales bacterium]|nr:sulfotransferase domain-containing protein [Acidimicrobiales bacterium]